MGTNMVRRGELSELFPTLRNDFFAPLQQEFDRLFDSVFSEFFGSPEYLGGDNLVDKMRKKMDFPRLDAYVQDGKYVIDAVVAGVRPEDLSVEVIEKDDVHVVKIAGKSEPLPEQARIDHRELRRSAFARTLTLPIGLKGYNDPDVSLQDGLLRLAWQVDEQPEPKDQVKRTVVWGAAEAANPKLANETRQARRELNKLAGTDEQPSS